jgi:ribosome-associated translation inhibitor RaiA
MLKQAHYADGFLSLHVDIPNAKNGSLKGTVKSDIQHGLLDSDYMTKAFEFKSKMPKTTFKLNTDTKLNGDILDTKVNLSSSLAKLDINHAVFNLKDTSLKSDYTAKILNLDKLFFVTQQHMKGGIVVNGDLSKAKDLDLNIHTKVAGGNIDAKLHNDDFHADLVKVDTLGLLHMLTYPELFKASLNAKVDYDLAASKGNVDGHVVDGHFVKNKTFDLIKQYAHINMYKETFKGDVSAKINKEKILANLDLKSRTSSIKTTATKLNTKTQQIDSKLLIVANKNPINTRLTGDINQPKVSVDLEAFMKSKAGKKVEKEVSRFLNKLF